MQGNQHTRQAGTGLCGFCGLAHMWLDEPTQQVSAWVGSWWHAVHADHCLALAQVGVLEAGELCVDCCEALGVLQTLPFQVLTPAAEALTCGTNNICGINIANVGQHRAQVHAAAGG
jgi:hypothetical protein